LDKVEKLKQHNFLLFSINELTINVLLIKGATNNLSNHIIFFPKKQQKCNCTSKRKYLFLYRCTITIFQTNFKTKKYYEKETCTSLFVSVF